MLCVLRDLFIDEMFFYKIILKIICVNKFLWAETKICPMGCPLLNILNSTMAVTFSSEKIIFYAHYFFHLELLVCGSYV